MAPRKNAKLDKIYEIFEKHGVDIDRDSIWEVQGTPVVKHKDVERLGAKLKIAYDIPTIIRSERDEAVIMVVGRMGDKVEWSIGEALINADGKPGGNYKVSGKQASYVYAMAEKRAKDRVILKIADLHGDVYSEEEADDFKDRGQRDNRPTNDNSKEVAGKDDNGFRDATVDDTVADEIFYYWEAEIKKCETVRDVMSLAGDKKFLAEIYTLSSKDEATLKKKVNDRAQDLKRGANAA